LIAAAAWAATINLSGTVAGSSSSFVMLKVVMRGNTPTKVTGFVAHAPAMCQGGPPFATAPFPKALTIGSSGGFKGQATLAGRGYTGTFKLSGKVSKNGKSASGTLKIDKKASGPVGECKTGTRSWTANAK
jgi:hypothetical protein